MDASTFEDWDKTVIILPWHTICGKCGNRAIANENKHITIPAAQTNDGPRPTDCNAEWVYATSSSSSYIESLKKSFKQFAWIGVIKKTPSGFTFTDFWL